MKLLWVVALICSVISSSFSQQVILKTNWEIGKEMTYKNTQILPVKGEGEYGTSDTITYYGTWKVVDKRDDKTIFDLYITGVEEGSEYISEDGMNTKNMWLAMVKAGKITYSTKSNGVYDTIISIDSLEAAVQSYCALMEYDCGEFASLDDVPDSIVSEITVEGDIDDEDYGIDWDDTGGGFDMTDLTRDALLEGIAKTLEYIHAYSGDTMEIGVERDLEDYPEYKKMKGDIAASQMEVTGTGLLTDMGDHYLYINRGSINMGNMMKMLYEAFSSLGEEDEGKKGKKKDKKKGAKKSEENDVPAELLNLSMKLNMDYTLTKESLLPIEFIITSSTNVPKGEDTKEMAEIKAMSIFRLISY